MSSALGLTKQNSNNLQLQVPNNHHNTSSNRSISSIFSKLKNENKITKDFKVEVLKKERKRIQNQFLIEKKAHPLEELLKDANDKFNFSYEIFYELCIG